MASPTKEELISSSSSTRQWSHDIFLSFRGEDTRYGFTGHLYTALCNHGLNTFFDTNLERGEEISKELLNTIEMSMISIVVLSENYASSTWCLNELVKILECRKTGRIRKVYPIFYKVTPSEVRKNEGKFGIALDNHEKKFKDDMEKVKGWKEALTEVANLSGREYKNGEYESEFIKRIIEEISSIKSIHIKLPIAKYPIEVYSQAEAIESLLDVESNGVFVVGIYGLGGVGKTTISKAVYNRINDCFEGSCFLENVRENSKTDAGIIQLQERLLSKILRSSIVKVNSVLEGITMIKERFCNKKVLLILDDVDQSKEVENLLEYCNWLASGSRVVITTRDKNVLPNLGRDPQIRTYEVQKMNPRDARVLFNMHAFGNNNPNQGYSNLVEQIISYADGLPLALVIMGSDLYGKSIDQWTCAVEKYKKIPHGEIINKLKISYDGLENRQRDIFLDIACFFKGFKMDEVVNILDACNLSSSLGISKLIEKCLITVDRRGILWMHDLLQQMGREIIEQESDELENRSRIWCYEDAYKLLTENMGSNKIRGIMWYSPKPRLVKLQADAFKNMRNLKFLLVKNVRISKGLKYLPNELRLLQWSEYDFLLSLKFYPHNLVVLNMPNSQIRLEKLLKQGRAFEALKDVNVCGCKFITKLPSLLCALNLKNLYMRDCVNLIEVHESVGELDKLERWDLAGCRNLEILPSLLGLRSLKYFNLENCRRLEKFPAIWAPDLNRLSISDCENLIEVHESVGGLDKLKRWDLARCRNLEILPSLLGLRSLKYFNLENCRRLEKFPAIWALNLESLSISHCKNLIEVHESVGELDKLERWDLAGCRNLEILPSLLGLRSLKYFKLVNCRRLEKFPAIWAPDLESLSISHCKNLIEVHESVGGLDKLERWVLRSCRNLEILPSLLGLRSLKFFSLVKCGRLEKFPAIWAPDLESLFISDCENLIEVHESVGGLNKLRWWDLVGCRNLEILPSLLGLRSLKDFILGKCGRLEKFPAIWAPDLESLSISDCENLIEVHESVGGLDKLERWILRSCRNLEILPSLLGLRSLEYLNLENCGLARLKTIRIENCKQLREIPTLPQSVRCVFVCGCPSVDPQSFSRLLIQFGGARSNISMDPKVSTEIPPTKMSSPFHDSDSESEDEDEDENLYSLSLPLTEIPKDLKFNHQTFGNSVSFWVGKKFSKLAICIAFRTVEAHMHYNCMVNISINGYKQILHIGFFVNWIKVELRLLSIRFEKLKKQKLSEQNHIEVEVLTSPGNSIDLIKWLGVNLECTCYPQNSDVTCLPLPCAMNGCGSSSIPNDTELPPLLPVSSTSYASDSDHRVLNNGRNLSKKTQWKKLRTCWSRTPKVKKNLSLTAEPSRGRSSNPWRWSSSLIKSLLHFPNNT